MRKILIALAVGTGIGLAPMFAEQAEAQRFGGMRGGGIGRVGGIGPGGGIGRVGIGGGIGRVGVGRVGGIGLVGIGRVGWGGGIGRVGIGRVGWGPRVGAVGWGARRVAWGGWPGWRVRRAAWWGAPLAVGFGVEPSPTGLVTSGTRITGTSTCATRPTTAGMAPGRMAASIGSAKSGGVHRTRLDRKPRLRPSQAPGGLAATSGRSRFAPVLFCMP